jgi:hypothetical protein
MYDMKSDTPRGNDPVGQSPVQNIYRQRQAAEKAWDASHAIDEKSEETKRLGAEYTGLMDQLWRAEAQTPQDVATLARGVWHAFGAGVVPGSDRYAEAMAEPQNVALWALCEAAGRVAGLNKATNPAAESVSMGAIHHKAMQLEGLIEALDQLTDLIGPRGNPLTSIIQVALPLAKSLSDDLEKLP